MYAHVLKSSEAARKAWETRKRTSKEFWAKGPDGKGLDGKGTTPATGKASAKPTKPAKPAKPATVGNTGLTPKEYSKAVTSVKNLIADAEAVEQEGIRNAAKASGMTDSLKKVLPKGAEFEAFEGTAGSLSIDNDLYSKLVANAKAQGFKITESKSTVGELGPDTEGSQTYKVPSEVSMTHKDGSKIVLSSNRDFGDFAAMDLDYFPAKSKTKKAEFAGSLQAALGIR